MPNAVPASRDACSRATPTTAELLRKAAADPKSCRSLRVAALETLCEAGEEAGPAADELFAVTTKRSDIRMVARAFARGWPMSAARRQWLIADLQVVVADPSSPARLRKAAEDALAAAAANVKPTGVVYDA